jgi:hypothetical protein
MTRKEERDEQIEMTLAEDVKAASFERPIAMIIKLLKPPLAEGWYWRSDIFDNFTWRGARVPK